MVAEAVVVAIHSILVMFGLSIYTLDDANLAFQEHYRIARRFWTSGRSLPLGLRPPPRFKFCSRAGFRSKAILCIACRGASRLATRLLALHPAPPPQRHFRFCFLSSQNARLPSVDARLDVLEQGRVEDARRASDGRRRRSADELQARRLHLETGGGWATGEMSEHGGVASQYTKTFSRRRFRSRPRDFFMSAAS